MLSQTFGSRYDQDTMVLNGPLVRLGAFSDIRTHKAVEDGIEVDFTIDGPTVHYGLSGITKINCKFNFGQGGNKNRIYYTESDFHPPVNSVAITIHKMVDGIEKVEQLVLSLSGSAGLDSSIPRSNQKGLFEVQHCSLSDIDELAKEYPGYRILGCERNAIIPHVLHLQYDHTRKMSAHVIGLISGNVASRKSLLDDEIDGSEIVISTHFFRILKICIEEEYEELTNTFEAEFPKHLSDDMVKKLGTLSMEKIKRRLAKVHLNIEPEVIDGFLEHGKPSTLQDWSKFLDDLPSKDKKALTELIDKHRNRLQSAWCEGSEEEVREVSVPLRSIFYLASYLSTYFSRSIKYLGPLRNEPQAVYISLGHTDPNHVGLKGEYTAAALHINRFKSITYPSPIAGENEQFGFRIKEAPLQDACREWLAYLGVVVNYRTRDRGKLGYEIYVKTNEEERWQDLTHVGVGVSQVLPIVLMFLLSLPEDLLIFEQPELHLHPKIQSRLCDFFTAMSAVNRQCLIETHSEYLINRLRLRIAQSRDDEVRANSSVFFVKKIDGLSTFSNVEITKYGVIPDWPEDFFDQTDMEIQKLLIAATVKRNEERRGNPNASGIDQL